MQTKTCASDIPTHFLKDHLDEFAVTLTKSINKSLKLGHFQKIGKLQFSDLWLKREMPNLLSLILDQLVIFHLYEMLQRE